eukprot:CAMPEP_0119549032 /NCGR_PEP_ID=MMETSP1352-20130426/2816_1 /TAXON_ID=265584 /ORGANISM="Stauroneis constricta, Strain CCMP1120" /LENGTH=276 /DNA_ID=CAMNT_0007594469 /DNA_START=512 /DNA_END=1342 /DNA_ORIENTATION=+
MPTTTAATTTTTTIACIMSRIILVLLVLSQFSPSSCAVSAWLQGNNCRSHAADRHHHYTTRGVGIPSCTKNGMWPSSKTHPRSVASVVTQRRRRHSDLSMLPPEHLGGILASSCQRIFDATRSSMMASARQSRAVNAILKLRGGAGSVGGGNAAAAGGGILMSFIKYIESSPVRSWMMLVAAILIESCAVSLLKVARNTMSLKSFGLAFTLYFTSISAFAIALKNINVSVAYAIWAALGTAVVSATGVLYFGESIDAVKISCLMMIIAGVIGLNMR